MKTVWILNHYAQEPGGPGGTRHFSLARHLREHGWRAIVVASSVEHGTGRQRLADGEQVRLDTYDGVEFLWLRGNSYAGNGGDRIRNMFRYTTGALRIPTTLLPAPDIVVGSSVHPFAAWAGARLARRFGVPFIFEIRDLWPQTLIDMGRFKPYHPMALALGWLEGFLCRKASRVVTLLPNADRYLRTIGVSPDRVSWISNGVDITDESLLPPHTEARPFTFMYFGSHGAANGLAPILEAFALLLREKGLPQAWLRLIGEGPEKANLIELAARLKVGDSIKFEAAIPKIEIPIVAMQADAFVVNLRNLDTYRYGISLNKLFDYLAAERPIVFAGSAVNNPVSDAGAGVSIPADDVNGIKSAMRELLLATPEARAAMGLAGRKYVLAHYSYRTLAAKFARVLDECTNAT